jgi:lysozyme family protein
MLHPFNELRSEYDSLLARCQITRRDAVDHVVRTRLLPAMPRYVRALALIDARVPPALIAGLHNRESDADFNTYLGNGERLDRVTRLVPKGRGPFSPPVAGAWERGAADAIRLDRLDDNSAPWSMAYALWKAEGYNGFGPRAHGRHSGYLWAGTNVYTGGKYVADGVWSASAFDQQLGVVPLLLKIAELAPQFAITGMPAVQAPSIAPDPLPVPEGMGGVENTKAIQFTINRWAAKTPASETWYPLAMDGSYGRMTRRAVREFQAANGLTADGLAGPNTINALRRI